MHFINNAKYNYYIICNKDLREECDKEEHVAVSWLLLLLPVCKQDCETSCPLSCIGPVIARTAPQ